MDNLVKTEIRNIALGFDLKYKISNMRMETYLAPAYADLKRRHSELRFEEFISEIVQVREEGRKRAGTGEVPESNPGVAPLLEEWARAFEQR
jgi:hypothetical protein